MCFKFASFCTTFGYLLTAASTAMLPTLLLASASTEHVRIVAYGEPQLEFAARETRRYIRLTTGAHADLVRLNASTLSQYDELILIATSRYARNFAATNLPKLATTLPTTLAREHHSIRVTNAHVLIVGGSRSGALFGAYTLAEQLGVVFTLHGDILPDATKPLPHARCANAPLSTCLSVTALDLTPTFDHRGLQPFHDFGSGPDWWSASMYKHVVANLAKMKMNFLGLHTYPYSATEGTGKDEPTVWVGPLEGLTADGSVKIEYAYPTSYASSLREEWGQHAMNTSSYSWGTAKIYDRECYGATVQAGEGLCPWPTTNERAAAIFEATSTLLADAFAFADLVDVDTCVGTETPLSKPPVPHGPVPTSEALYDGIFTRLLKKIPSLDWFWIWTPESWEWQSMDANNPIFTDAVYDMENATVSRNKINPNLKLLTNGWDVGPLPDRSIFDKKLSNGFEAITSIDQHFGQYPVDPAYKNVTKHAKWVIPWMEDDPSLTAPQLWLNRTLEHMTDAHAYGITGLLGIHWRTHAVSPTIAAMGQRSWQPTLTSAEFWAQWSSASFGTGAGATIAAIFDSVDSFKMPTPASWNHGPGQLMPSNASCRIATDNTTYAFVAALEDARADVGTGVVDIARYEYWLNSFQYMRSIPVFTCALAHKNAALAVARGGITAERAVKLAAAVDALATAATTMMTLMQQTITSPGELGTYYNLEGFTLLGALGSAEERAEVAGILAAAGVLTKVIVPSTYQGAKPRLIVPVPRATVTKGEALTMRALVLAKDASGCETPSFNYHDSSMKPSDPWHAVPMKLVAPGRAVYVYDDPAQKFTDDFDYYVSMTCLVGDMGSIVVFPAGSPYAAQSVTVV